MAYDESIAERVRKVVEKGAAVTEKRMFGGIAYMVRGHMCCGVLGEKLMVRVGPDGYEAALSQPHARKMDFTGKPLKGFVYVDPRGFSSDKDLEAWVSRGVKYALSLPKK